MVAATAGRVNQKQRTRMAIVAAARALLTSGEAMNMPAVAKAALVSEATAYRYFPDLASLLREAFDGVWNNPADALAQVADNTDPVERIGFATEVLLREVLAYQGAVRAVMSAAIIKPDATLRPGRRFGLIDHALAPLDSTVGKTDPVAMKELKRSLAIVVSAEALFTLTDLCGLAPEEAVKTVVDTAKRMVAAVLTGHGRDRSER